MLRQYTYDMLILDLNMPSSDGLELITQSIAIQPDLKILVVTVNQESVYGPRCFNAGALGFLRKTHPDHVVKEAILKISKGKRFISEDLSEIFTNSFLKEKPSNPFDSLSTREFEVATLLLKGYGAIEVANALSINTSTASSYRGRIFSKLGIKTFIELVRLARQFQIVNDLEV